MDNNLRNLEKDLRAFAKRNQNVTYTKGLLMTFLITGTISLSTWGAIDTTQAARQGVSTAITDMRQTFSRARQENQALLKGANLELIQLMEQGDQVVKSPWSSWQFGVNTFIGNQKGTYKGKGDKKQDVIYGRESKFSTSSNVESKYGKTGLENLKEPIATVPVDASVNPKSINKTALNVNLPTINAPSAPNLNVKVSDPVKVETINPELPDINPNLPKPNTNPFSDFTFTDGFWNRSNLDDTGKIFWAGYNPNMDGAGNVIGYTQGFGNSNVTPETDKRTGVLVYLTNGAAKYGDSAKPAITMHIAGDTGGAGKVGTNSTGTFDSGSLQLTGTAPGAGVLAHDGQIGFHLYGKNTIENVNINMYGKANAFSLETWQMHDWGFKDVNIKIVDTGVADENVIFNIYPSPYETTLAGLSNRNRGKFDGAVNADLTTKKNIVYSVVGNAGSFVIDSNHGDYNLEGSGNTFYSGLGYQANYGKMLGGTGIGNIATTNGTGNTETDWKPYLDFNASKIKMTGDENIGLFFSDNVSTNSTPYSNGSVSNWNKSVIGIYQGEIKNSGAVIGETLAISPTAITQTTQGNTGTIINANQWVEKNVGILAASGQRSGISAVDDLGATAASTSNNDFSKDVIHSLQINGADFDFGKYSKDGVLAVAQNGTVVDILKLTNEQVTGKISQDVLTDFGKKLSTSTTTVVVSEDQNINEAGTGTIIALAQGTWGNNGSNSSMSATTKNNLNGKASEINIGTDVEMASKYHDFTADGGKESYSIAYAALDGGVVNTEKNTTAHGYGTIIGYAKDGGTINATNGNFTAISDWAATDTETKKYTYHNVGGYAVNSVGKNSITTVNLGNTGTISTIHGLGGYADGENTVVNLNGTTNINTGKGGALVAKNKGKVNYYGGTINHKDNGTIVGANDHDNTTPFYADSNGEIIFQGATTLNMNDGVLITGVAGDYSSGLSAGKKYQNLNNVTVNLTSDNVTIGSFSGLAQTWDDSTDASNTFLNGLPGITQFNGGTINKNGHTYKTILTNGTLNITSPTVTLDSAADQYNGIQMANEVVTISNGTTVTGNVSSATIAGQGLSMGSLSTATSNATTGFNNDGTVNVTGGTTTSGIAGINVSYGTINNNATGSVTIDNGAGLYGTNGSKLVNAGTITVSGSGVGIAGLGTGTTKQDYGTDVLNAGTIGATKTVEIVNSGTINVSGNKAVAIYAENNTNAPRANVTVDNTSALTVGDDGVGIAVVSKAPATTVNHGATTEGGVITVTSTGGTDITAGINGIGIYAEDSNININNAGGNYVVETKDNGVGIFASGNSTTNNGTLEYKYNGANTASGMGIVFDTQGTTNNTNVILNNATSTTGGIVGVYTTATTGTFTNNGNITGTSSEKEFGIVTNGANVVNNGNITLANATTQANANVGIYAKAPSTITNNGNITVGDNAIGIYGYRVNHNSGTIQTGDNGIGIYTQGTGTGSNDVVVNSAINVGTNQSVGVYAVGNGQDISSTSSSSFGIGDNSFGFVNAGTGNKITSNTPSVTLGTDAVYIYQNDATGQVFNNTNLTSTGDKNYGLYGNGTIQNNGTIDFSTGVGNVGIYSTGGVATNDGLIKVGASNTSSKLYGVGMATGHYDVTTGTFSNEGTIVNKGTIEVSQPNSMGMYAVGSNSKAVNYGNINLTGSNTIGMYLDRGAVGENWGTIQTTAGGLTSVKGVYIANGSYLKNYGTINIGASDPKSAGIWSDQSSAKNVVETATGTNPITGVSQTGTSTPAMHVAAATDEKMYGGITIKTPPAATPVSIVDANGNPVELVGIDTNIISPTPTDVIITAPSGITTLDLTATGLGSAPNTSQATSVGMYVDTSGVNYTNPINGLSNLVGLTDINLMFGVEAAKYTNAKAIQVGDNILDPYNTALAGVVSPGTTLNVTSGSLTWMAQPVKSAATGLLDTLYLVKAPYQAFAAKGDTDTYNFLDGLEQRYGTGSAREKELFNKLNDLGKGEGHIFAQAVDQMKGFQYSNVQQRLNATGNMLDKEFDYLADEWETKSKQSNKIKVFGMRDEYNTDTAGIIDYSSNGYGVAYLHEDETVKLGDTTGWYAGAVHNRFRFKDIGKSKENTTMLKAGVFKSTPFDHNNSLNWTIAGEGFIARSEMDRRFWVVDDVFESKSGYTSYGLGLKNEISKTFRTGEKTSIKPYASLDMEYGRFNNISEKSGEINLEVKGNDYFSVKPELGMEFKYRTPFAKRSILITKLNVAYENELGKLGNVGNQARVKGTTANWYNLSNEKEDRKGNVKADLNIGIENGRVGFTANLGYDTKGKNVRGGLGIRAIY